MSPWLLAFLALIAAAMAQVVFGGCWVLLDEQSLTVRNLFRCTTIPRSDLLHWEWRTARHRGFRTGRTFIVTYRSAGETGQFDASIFHHEGRLLTEVMQDMIPEKDQP